MKNVVFFAFLLFSSFLHAQFTDTQLGLTKGLVYSQIGYLPSETKEILYLGDTLQIVNSAYTVQNQSNQIVKTGNTNFVQKQWRRNAYSIDLSDITIAGIYKLKVNNDTATIIISDQIIKNLKINEFFTSIFNYQRTDKAEHLNDKHLPLYTRNGSGYVSLNKTVSGWGGWRDAKSDDQHLSHAVIISDLLNAYEANPSLFNTDLVNNVPRILLEVKWGLTYLLSVQNPSGSFYCTVLCTPWDVSMPARGVVNDTSTYLNARACAALAQGYNNLKSYFPTFADSCLNAAKKGWDWHLKYPNITINEPEYWNAKYDSRLFAALELWLATNSQNYLDTLNAGINRGVISSPATQPWMAWWHSGMNSDWDDWFGMRNLLLNSDILTVYAKYYPLANNTIKTKINADATFLKNWLNNWTNNPYKFYDLLFVDYFGMSGFCSMTSARLLYLGSVINDSLLINYGLKHLHYVLGRNPVGKSFVGRIGTNINNNKWWSYADTLKGAVFPGIIMTTNLPSNNCALSGDIGSLGWRCDEWSTISTSALVLSFSLLDKMANSSMSLQSIILNQGWNLISTNVHPTDSSINTLFKGLNVQEIKTMDAFWRKGQNTVLNKLTTIEAGKGYLVKMNIAGTLQVIGTPSVETLQSMSLRIGWNLVGCPYQTATALSGIFNNTNSKTVKNFDGFWISGGTTNSIQNLNPGKGYFVKK
jgi:hypothetical protein